MGKITGFLEFERKEAEDRNVRTRVNDWKEFHNALPQKGLKQQGARCMDCGIPFCHHGTIISGNTTGCPVNNLIPEWNDMVYRGLWKEALFLLEKTNNFPEFTGRICPAPCEAACVLGINEPPVTIKNIENAIIEKGFAKGWVVPRPPETRTGKKVAIVGSGPAGLACADQLNKVGHKITVFERDDRIGGLLTYGIPNMKLDKGVVQRRVDLLAAEGIKFQTKAEVGVTISVEQLEKDFDAVVLCIGALEPRNVSLEGRNLQGIHFAMEYLLKNTKSLLDSGLEDGNFIDARDKNVIVIGGGDTGSDCVATAMRHGCRSVRQFQIHDQPPQAKDQANPSWPEWPNVYLLDYAQQEAKAKFGGDPREHHSLTKRFVGDESGNVKAIHLIDVQWVDDGSGRFVPKEIEGSERAYDADLILISIGFRGPETQLLDKMEITRNNLNPVKYTVAAEYGKYKTNKEGVFSAGDARRGQSLVVWAIHEGREAAREVDKYLMGETELP